MPAFFSFSLRKVLLLSLVILVASLLVFAYLTGYLLFRDGFFRFGKQYLIKVGNQYIAGSDYEEALNRERGFLKYASPAASLEEIQGIVIEKLKKKTVIEQEAQLRGITVSEEEITAEIEERVKKAGGSDALQNILGFYGWSAEDLREKVKEDLLEKKLRDKLTAWREYQLLMIRWDSPPTSQMPSGERKELARQLITQAREEVSMGSAFSNIFAKLKLNEHNNKDVSVQGSPESMRAGRGGVASNKSLDDHIFNLKQGEVGEVWELQGAFTFGVVVDLNEGVTSSFDEWLRSKIDGK